MVAGLRMARMEKYSARYEMGLFVDGDQDSRAEGHFIPVYVDHTTTRPTLRFRQPLRRRWRRAL